MTTAPTWRRSCATPTGFPRPLTSSWNGSSRSCARLSWSVTSASRPKPLTPPRRPPLIAPTTTTSRAGCRCAADGPQGCHGCAGQAIASEVTAEHRRRPHRRGLVCPERGRGVPGQGRVAHYGRAGHRGPRGRPGGGLGHGAGGAGGRVVVAVAGPHALRGGGQAG